MAGKFAFFESFWEAAKDLDDKNRLAFYDAIADYAFTGAEPEFKGVMSTIWKLVKPNIDSSLKGQQTGRSGGRGNTSKPPVSNVENPPFSNPETTSKPDMDMDMDRDKDMDREDSFSGRKKNLPLDASVGASAAKAAPPSAPRCPLCDSKLYRNTQTGRWTCPTCCESFDPSKVAA